MTNLPPDAYEALLDAYAEGGDQAVADFLSDYWSNTYLTGWHFDSIEDIDVLTDG